MFRPGGDQIDPGGLDAAVAQDVRELRNILTGLVKDAGKQVPEVVGEHLAG